MLPQGNYTYTKNFMNAYLPRDVKLKTLLIDSKLNPTLCLAITQYVINYRKELINEIPWEFRPPNRPRT